MTRAWLWEGFAQCACGEHVAVWNGLCFSCLDAGHRARQQREADGARTIPLWALRLLTHERMVK